jgi:hypothetical protein
MRFFRRNEETLNEQLLREAGLDRPTVRPAPTPAPPPSVPLERPRAWDVATTVKAPGVGGSEVEFVALPNGDLIVEDEEGDTDLSGLADTVEPRLQPPYRVRARRLEGDSWGVTANAIDVVELEAEGDTIEVTCVGGAVTTTVDGRPVDRSFPLLERDGDYNVVASRIDGGLWEVRASAL